MAVQNYQITITVRAAHPSQVYDMFKKQIDDYRVESFEIKPEPSQQRIATQTKETQKTSARGRDRDEI